MKKAFIFFLSTLLLASCTRNNRKQIVISKFTERFVDSLTPSKKMVKSGYVSYTVEIKGYVNDSVKFNLYDGEESSSFYLKGNINNKFIDEYSGCCPRYLFFDPYKATEGELEIKYGLY